MQKLSIGQRKTRGFQRALPTVGQRFKTKGGVWNVLWPWPRETALRVKSTFSSSVAIWSKFTAFMETRPSCHKKLDTEHPWCEIKLNLGSATLPVLGNLSLSFVSLSLPITQVLPFLLFSLCLSPFLSLFETLSFCRVCLFARISSTQKDGLNTSVTVFGTEPASFLASDDDGRKMPE